MSIQPPVGPYGLKLEATADQANFYGSEIPTSSAPLADANATITVAAGAQYVMADGTMTANRVITLGTSGSPLTGEMIAILRRDTGAYTLTVNDDAASALVVLPASRRYAAYFRFDGTHYVLSGAIRIK